jgi:hypothetical protein
MRAIVIALIVAAVALSGCGSKGKPASPSPGSRATTYTSQAHNFALTYDPAVFHPKTQSYQGQLSLRLSARGFTGGVLLVADPEGRQYVQQALAGWHKRQLDAGKSLSLSDSFDSWSLAASGGQTAQWVTLNGIRGVRTESRKGLQQTVAYMLMSGGEVYALSASAPTAQWTTDAATLDSVLHSFRVLK